MEEGKKNVFAEHLRELRARLSLTQKEFAQRVSITPATLSSYENGTKSPPISTVIRIAEEYKISLDWLCGIKNDEENNGYKVSYKVGLRYFACILKTFSGIEYSNEATMSRGTSIPGHIDITNRELANFLDSLTQLIALNNSGTLDDSMLDACIERASSNAVKKIIEADDDDDEIPF